MILGIDIGTSTISIVLAEPNGRQIVSHTLRNESTLSGHPHNNIQDPDWIYATIEKMYAQLRATYNICAIGITCQMHGILYVDKHGRAVSPLYTWEDEMGQQLTSQGKTYLEELNQRTPTGFVKGIAYGSLTHFVLTYSGQLPDEAVCFCSIGDYVGLRLTEQKQPMIHVSIAASFGLYNLEQHCFDVNAIRCAEMDPSYFPEILHGHTCLGKDRYGIPVSVAIGDNQASFLGSVTDFGSEVLLNLGTGGQISCYTDKIISDVRIDTRPLLENSFLAVYTSHCGGRAYAALEQFFREVLALAGVSGDNLYSQMNTIAQQSMPYSPIQVQTAFCGSRLDPQATGSMSGITLENFTPQSMILGFMTGICKELYPFFEELSRTRNFCSITGSGNLIRRNTAMQNIIERVFKLPLKLSETTEEAAMGAIWFAKQMSGGFENAEY